MAAQQQPRRVSPIFSLPGVCFVVATYALIHATTRLFASGNLGEDDVLDTLLIQQLLPGYSVERGPLYDWLLWAIQQLLGTGLQGFLLLKYSLLVAMAGALYCITRRLTGSPLWAFISVESMATVYQIFWRFHEGFTHRVGAMALVALTLLAAFRLVDYRRTRDALLLGVLIGLGLLSEHIYAYFLISLGLSALPQANLRQRLTGRQLAVLVLPILAIVFPYANWLSATPERWIAFTGGLIPHRDAPSVIASLRDALTFPIFVLSPYILIVVATFPRLFVRNNATDHAEPSRYDLKRWLGTLLVVELSGHLIGNGILFSQSDYPVHSILPMLVIAIPWLTAAAYATQPSELRTRVFMLILLAFTATAYGVRSGNLFVYEPFCSRCRWGTPYVDLAEQLRAVEPSPGSFVTDDLHTAGNLRRFFPSTPVVLRGRDATSDLSGLMPEPRLIIWVANKAEPAVPDDLRELVPDGAISTLVTLPWHPPFKKPGYRQSTWAVVRTAPTN